MKPFIGIDLTKNKKNEKMNGDEFIVQKVSAPMADALNASNENAIGLLKKALLPTWVRVGNWICGAVAVVIAGGIIKALDEVTLSEAYGDLPWLFWLAGACALAWIALTVIGRKRLNSTLESDESVSLTSRFDTIANNIFAELNVPLTAVDVDVISFAYKTKNGEAKAYLNPLSTDETPYNNYSYKLFADEEKIYLADLDGKCAFPRASLRGITAVKKKIVISNWNKDIEYNEGDYKEYKIKPFRDDEGYVIKSHYILTLEHCGEIWGIYFPDFELPAFERVTGLKAE